MVSIDQIANGLMIYARDYLIGQIPKDNVKFIAGNVALEVLGLTVNRHKDELRTKVQNYLSSSQWAGFLDIITPDGMVDIETLRTIVPKYVQPEGFKVKVPMIGVFTIQPNDIDVIYNCIVNFQTAPKALGGV